MIPRRPCVSSGSPSTSLPSGTTGTTLSLSTNENATCKYSLSSGTAYASMSNTFGTTGSTSHSTAVSSLVDGGSYGYYVRCQDGASNPNSDDYLISFSVLSPSGDIETPTAPSGLIATPTTSTVSLTWNASTDNIAVTGYKVFRNSVEIATSATTSYTDTGLTPSTAYAYEVSRLRCGSQCLISFRNNQYHNQRRYRYPKHPFKSHRHRHFGYHRFPYLGCFNRRYRRHRLQGVPKQRGNRNDHGQSL